MVFAIPGYGLKGIEQGLLRLGKNSEGLPDLDDEMMRRMLEEDEKQKRSHQDRVRDWHRIAAGNEILEKRVVQAAHDMLAYKVDAELERRIIEGWDQLMMQRRA